MNRVLKMHTQSFESTIQTNNSYEKLSDNFGPVEVVHGVLCWSRGELAGYCVCHHYAWHSCPTKVKDRLRGSYGLSADEKWAEKQARAIENHKAKGRGTEAVPLLNYSQIAEKFRTTTDLMLQQRDRINKLQNQLNKINTSDHGTDGVWSTMNSLSKRIDSVQQVRYDQLKYLQDIQKTLSSDVVIDVSPDRVGEIDRDIQKNERKLRIAQMKQKRATICFLLSLPPAILASVGVGLGLAVIFLPALTIMFVGLVIGMYAAPVPGSVNHLEELLIDQRYDQGRIINASLTGYSIPDMPKIKDGDIS